MRNISNKNDIKWNMHFSTWQIWLFECWNTVSKKADLYVTDEIYSATSPECSSLVCVLKPVVNLISHQ